jgi:hypothetical protein
MEDKVADAPVADSAAGGVEEAKVVEPEPPVAAAEPVEVEVEGAVQVCLLASVQPPDLPRPRCA